MLPYNLMAANQQQSTINVENWKTNSKQNDAKRFNDYLFAPVGCYGTMVNLALGESLWEPMISAENSPASVLLLGKAIKMNTTDTVKFMVKWPVWIEHRKKKHSKLSTFRLIASTTDRYNDQNENDQRVRIASVPSILGLRACVLAVASSLRFRASVRRCCEGAWSDYVQRCAFVRSFSRQARSIRDRCKMKMDAAELVAM